MTDQDRVDILNWLEEKEYQTDREETGEYKMYFALDMPKILTDFLEYKKATLQPVFHGETIREVMTEWIFKNRLILTNGQAEELISVIEHIRPGIPNFEWYKKECMEKGISSDDAYKCYQLLAKYFHKSNKCPECGLRGCFIDAKQEYQCTCGEKW